MKVQFKRSVCLKGKDYSKGSTHELPDDILEDPFFGKLMKAGLVEDGVESAKISTPSLQDRQKKLAELLEKRQAAKLEASKQLASPPEDDGDEVKESKKSKKKG